MVLRHIELVGTTIEFRNDEPHRNPTTRSDYASNTCHKLCSIVFQSLCTVKSHYVHSMSGFFKLIMIMTLSLRNLQRSPGDWSRQCPSRIRRHLFARCHAFYFGRRRGPHQSGPNVQLSTRRRRLLGQSAWIHRNIRSCPLHGLAHWQKIEEYRHQVKV